MSELGQGAGPAQSHCRGCGRLLPLGWRGLFHPDCLKVDKRRRVRQKRRLDRERFERWLGRLRCPECGSRLGSRLQDSRGSCEERLCEASQGPKGRRKRQDGTRDTQELPSAKAGENPVGPEAI